jgi:hypothetical protein
MAKMAGEMCCSSSGVKYCGETVYLCAVKLPKVNHLSSYISKVYRFFPTVPNYALI